MYMTLNGSDNCTAIAPRPCNGRPMLRRGLEVVGLIIIIIIENQRPWHDMVYFTKLVLCVQEPRYRRDHRAMRSKFRSRLGLAIMPLCHGIDAPFRYMIHLEIRNLEWHP